MAPPRPVEVIDLDAELARVFQAAPGAFTERRNALASRLKAAGRPGDAGHVKQLTRPTAPAWAVNQLAWRTPDVLARLRAAGDRLRQEQEQALAGGSRDLRAAMVERRAAVDEAVAAAVGVLEQEGGPVTPATRERIAASCEAIATYGTGPGAPEVGRLTAEVASPGLAALTSLAAAARLAPESSRREDSRPAATQSVVSAPRAAALQTPPAAAPAPPRPAQPRPSAEVRAAERRQAAERQRAIASAKAALARAEQAAVAPQAALAAAARVRKDAERAAERAQREVDAARARYEQALDRSTLADRAAREAQQAEREATTRRDEAERAIRGARDALRHLDETPS